MAIDLKVNVPHGQLEDFLKLTSKSGNVMLTGVVSTTAHLLIPPGHDPVEQRLKLDGTFQLSDAQFASEKIQEKIQQLSLRGQGKPDELKKGDPAPVQSAMSGTFHMANGIIALPNLDYKVPGADIQLQGSYALDGPLEFTGTARMDATVSQMVGGWKGLLLKPADKFFKKDGAGTQVPLTIKGTREAPEFAVDFGRMEIKSTKAESPADKHPQTPQ
jgi:AsmA-like C-terminal region